jgi:hypothetical protein
MSAVSLLLAAMAWSRAQAARDRVRRLQHTIEEMIGLIEALSDRGEESAVATKDRSPLQAPPAGVAASAFLPSGAGRGSGAALHQRVLEMNAAGTGTSAVCRETGLSHGEVKLLIALAERTGGVAG